MNNAPVIVGANLYDYLAEQQIAGSSSFHLHLCSAIGAGIPHIAHPNAAVSPRCTGDTLSAFDVCAVPEAFGADNVVPDSFERIEYRRRSDCPTRSPLPKRTVVRIEKIEGRGDTVIVHAYRDRGDLKHLEQYRFFYRGWMLVMDYTIPNGYTWR